MTPVIEMQPLSRNRRRIIFGLSILLFVIAVPTSVFYAIGYRFDFSDKFQSIKSVGGMYVRNETPNTEMFVDGAPVTDLRIFQKAAYIQNLEAGMHRMHVQGVGLQTWVKELPVHAHFVTEVSSFTMPAVPQVRLITPHVEPRTQNSVVYKGTTSTLAFASTTNTFFFSSTTATSAYDVNPEYTYIKTKFASSSEAKERAARIERQKETPKKSYNLPTTTIAEIATTTKTWRNFKLFARSNDVFVSFVGDRNNTPYYYCINYENEITTKLQYGSHVFASLASSTELKGHKGERVCRSEIRIDNKNKQVLDFDFIPGSGDLLLMLLEDGLYVVEADDRAWQNTQLLYPGEKLALLVDGGRIYIHDRAQYLEVFTELR